MVAVGEYFFHGNHAAHFFWVLHALDHVDVSTRKIFFHFDETIRPTRHVALELAGVETSITFFLAWSLALDLCVVKVNQMTFRCAVVTAVQSLFTYLVATIIGGQFSEIIGAPNLNNLVRVNLAPKTMKRT